MKLKTTVRFLVVSCITIGGVSCGNKPDKAAKETNTLADTAKSVASKQTATTAVVVKLICKELGEDSIGTPHFNVLLSVDGKEVKIKTINGCANIPKTEYKTYEIPDEAISACGGWWAGAGDYYYVIMRGGKPLVFEGWQDETQKEKGYHWKEIAVK